MVDEANGEVEVVASVPQAPGPQQHQVEVVAGMEGDAQHKVQVVWEKLVDGTHQVTQSLWTRPAGGWPLAGLPHTASVKQVSLDKYHRHGRSRGLLSGTRTQVLLCTLQVDRAARSRTLLAWHAGLLIMLACTAYVLPGITTD